MQRQCDTVRHAVTLRVCVAAVAVAWCPLLASLFERGAPPTLDVLSGKDHRSCELGALLRFDLSPTPHHLALYHIILHLCSNLMPELTKLNSAIFIERKGGFVRQLCGLSTRGSFGGAVFFKPKLSVVSWFQIYSLSLYFCAHVAEGLDWMANEVPCPSTSLSTLDENCLKNSHTFQIKGLSLGYSVPLFNNISITESETHSCTRTIPQLQSPVPTSRIYLTIIFR